MSTRQKKVAVAGASGRMGSTIIRLLKDDPELELFAAVEAENHPDAGKEILPGLKIICDWKKISGRPDVIIDFTSPQGVVKNMKYAVVSGIPVVIGTTGFSAGEKALIVEHSGKIPVLLSPNMSLGVNFVMDIVKYAAALAGENYEVEIVETHHHDKKDAPSGTALKLGEIICSVRKRKPEETLKYGRHGQTGKRTPGEVCIHAVRMGNVIGEHSVFFAGKGETIEITHRCSSRESFAAGAILAAKFLSGRKPGMYDMKNVVEWIKGL